VALMEQLYQPQERQLAGKHRPLTLMAQTLMIQHEHVRKPLDDPPQNFMLDLNQSGLI